MECIADQDVIEGSFGEWNRRAVEAVKWDRVLTKVLHVHAHWLHRVHLLQILGEIPGPAPDVENTVTLTDIVSKHFSLILKSNRGPEHVRCQRDTLDYCEDSCKHARGKPLSGGQFHLHSNWEHDQILRYLARPP